MKSSAPAARLLSPLFLLLVLLTMLLAAAAAAGPAAAHPFRHTSPYPVRWIDVSVATLWTDPSYVRPVDAASLTNPADPGAWVATMTVEQKLWLADEGALETQALYGTRVYVLETRGDWSKIAVTGQPTPRNELGYPGWVPTCQLTDHAPRHTFLTAVVRDLRAQLWQRRDLSVAAMEVSYGTRLQVDGMRHGAVKVVLLDGRRLYVDRDAVVVQSSFFAWSRVSGADVVREARTFLGLGYLWAGTSGYCVDGSGLTHLVYSGLGITIPRDGTPQYNAGRRITAKADLRAGDVVFFGKSGQLYNCAIYTGADAIIIASRTGEPVAEKSLLSEPYATDFAGAGRFVCR